MVEKFPQQNSPEQNPEKLRADRFRAALIELVGLQEGDKRALGSLASAEYEFGPEWQNRVRVDMNFGSGKSPVLDTKTGHLKYPKEKMLSVKFSDKKIGGAIEFITRLKIKAGKVVENFTAFELNENTGTLNRRFNSYQVKTKEEQGKFMEDWARMTPQEQRAHNEKMSRDGILGWSEAEDTGMHDVGDEALDAFLEGVREAVKTGRRVPSTFDIKE